MLDGAYGICNKQNCKDQLSWRLLLRTYSADRPTRFYHIIISILSTTILLNELTTANITDVTCSVVGLNPYHNQVSI
jgi:hypothetical protein